MAMTSMALPSPIHARLWLSGPVKGPGKPPGNDTSASPLPPDLPKLAQTDRPASLATWIGIMGAMLGAFMAVLNIQIVNASLGEIQGGIGAGIDDGGWVSTSYLIGEIIVIPLTDFLSRVFSLRRFLLTMGTLFLVFSAACAFAGNLQEMIVFRALQGFCGGVLIPAAMTITLTKLPPYQHPIGLSVFTITAIFAPAIGPTIGGYLTENYGWQSIFFINLVPGVFMMGALIYALDPAPLQLRLLREGDWAGIGAMAVGLGTMQTVLEEGDKDDWFGSPFILQLSLISAVALTIFLIIELRGRKPLIDLRLLLNRNFALGTAAMTFFGVSLYGSVFLLPLYLSQIHGYNAEDIGKVMAWIGLPQLIIIPFVPKLMKRLDSRWIVMLGFFGFAASGFMNTRLSPDYSGDQFFIPNIVRAIGQAVIATPLTVIAMSGIARARAGGATGLFSMSRNIGGAFGTAMLQTLITKREQYHSAMINEKVAAISNGTTLRLNRLQHRFMENGVPDPAVAWHKAEMAVGHIIHHQALIMAYSDGFAMIGGCVAAAGIIVLFLRKSDPAASSNAGPAH